MPHCGIITVIVATIGYLSTKLGLGGYYRKEPFCPSCTFSHPFWHSYYEWGEMVYLTTELEDGGYNWKVPLKFYKNIYNKKNSVFTCLASRFTFCTPSAQHR